MCLFVRQGRDDTINYFSCFSGAPSRKLDGGFIGQESFKLNEFDRIVSLPGGWMPDMERR